jgi:hypothetical protein
MNEAEHLAQLRKQQKSADKKWSDSKISHRGDSDEDTSSVDTHLDECDICDDGGGKLL